MSDQNNGFDDNDGTDGDGGLSGRTAIFISALIGIGVTTLAYWWVGGWAGNEVFYETLFRVQPTVAGGGVGSDWVAGNTVPWLDALIAITHAADVIMGVFILGMVFLHWAAFRRLANRMQSPTSSEAGDTVATDGSGVGREKSSHEGGDRR
ncbi:hypothetical protein [Haladaptatus salinisoli]|uniref:hypothetical protein n=1 Tax=Haladaptatus salinisoli TaxID=2884876 RepID=UPI001D0AA2EB|nr:hypothetical protein [Haladaptatus salinisoli]